MSGYTPPFARPDTDSLGTKVTSMGMNFESTRVVIGGSAFNLNAGIVKVYDYIASTNSWVQVGSDLLGDENGRFGASLDMDWDGNTIVVGAWGINTVYIYEYNGTSWVISATLSIPGPDGKYGWAVSISKDVPDTTAVTDPDNNDVYVYEKFPGTGWTEVFKNNGDSIQNIVPWDRNGNNYILKPFTNKYGYSVRLSAFGNHLIVGQPGDDSFTELTTSNTDFVPVGAYPLPTLVHPDPSNSEYFKRFSINRNKQIGSVRVFKTDNSWLTSNTQVGGDLLYDNLDNVQSDIQRTIPQLGWSYPGFGTSVDISPEGDMIVVGAPLYSVRGGDYTYHDGQVITYQLNDLGVWVKINVIPGLKSLKYGTALRLDYTGKRLVVTGCNNILSTIDVLDWNGTNWFETQPIYQTSTVNPPDELRNTCYITNGEVACLSLNDVGQFFKQLLTQAISGNTLVSGYIAADELYVGANDNVQKSSEKFSKSKRISFGGTYYDNTYEGATIENRVYKEWTIGTGTGFLLQQDEGRSELFIAKTSEPIFNFPTYNTTSGGVDFIRLKACEIHLDSYPLYGGDKYQQSPLLVLNYQKNVSIGLPFLDSATGNRAYFRGSSNAQAKLDVNGSTYVRNRLNINVDGGNDILGNLGEQGDVLWDTRNASTVVFSTISSNTIVNQEEQNVPGTIQLPATYSAIERAFDFTNGGKVTATRVMDKNYAKVSLWFKLTVLPGTDKQLTILGANDITSSANYIVIYVTTYGFKVIIKNAYVPDGGGSTVTRTITFTYNYSLVVGEWFHILASYDNNHLLIGIPPIFQLFISGQNALTPASTTGDIPEKLPEGLSIPFVVGGDTGMYVGMVMVWGGYAFRSPSHVMLYNNGPPSEMLKVGGDAVVSNKLAIGSTNPTEALEVTGNVVVSGSMTAASFTGGLDAANITGTLPVDRGGTGVTTSTGTGKVVLSDNPTFTSTIIGDSMYLQGSVRATSYTHDITNIYKLTISPFVQGSGNVGHKFVVQNIENFFDSLCLGSTGNVGMGTLFPGYALHVINDNPDILVGTSGQGGGVVWFGNPNHGVGRGISKGIFTDTNDVNLTTAGTGDAVISAGSGGSYIAIQADGNAISSDGSPFGLSDIRIKKNIIDIDDTYALEKLRDIKPRLYTYKSNYKHDETVFGFIAQEVRDTLPYSTMIGDEFIPNIQEYVTITDSNVIAFSTFTTDTLETSSNIIRVETHSNLIMNMTIVDVVDAHSIRVAEDLQPYMNEQLFVYGQMVKDFVFLKKESIFTVATAALQEVDRQLQAEKAKVATLEAQLASVLMRLDALEATS